MHGGIAVLTLNLRFSRIIDSTNIYSETILNTFLLQPSGIQVPRNFSIFDK